jgi:hypothetical protein
MSVYCTFYDEICRRPATTQYLRLKAEEESVKFTILKAVNNDLNMVTVKLRFPEEVSKLLGEEFIMKIHDKNDENSKRKVSFSWEMPEKMVHL